MALGSGGDIVTIATVKAWSIPSTLEASLGPLQHRCSVPVARMVLEPSPGPPCLSGASSWGPSVLRESPALCQAAMLLAAQRGPGRGCTTLGTVPLRADIGGVSSF